jgi:penicillin-binding protein 3
MTMMVEHKTDFPGFDVDFGGWKREYPYGETLSDVIGTVSTSTEGLPAESLEYYQSKGYQLNASVGKSGLEYYYNDLLTGTEEISIITYDSSGLAVKEVIQSAKAGYDLVLSINIDLQQSMDETVKTVLAENAGTKKRENFTSLFMCVLDPNDGSVLALSGYQIDLETKQMTYYASGCYTSLVNPGSCIKGATVYMGLSEGVVTADEIIEDKVMNIAGEEFGSYTDHGPVNAVQALSVSSNVYMFNIAIRLGGGVYVEGQPLAFTDQNATLNKMRSYYSMFGLGNVTGLDVPYEVSSFMGAGDTPGLLLNYSIGQFDMYSPLQLAQYASVIANDGSLWKPRLVDYALEVNSDEAAAVYAPELRSTLPEKNQQYLTTVQEGMRACVADGNCGTDLEDYPIAIAAKTGTAEVGEWTTANLVGYAPYDEPTMAFACSAPTSSINDENVAENICAGSVVPKVIQKYFELYPN